METAKQLASKGKDAAAETASTSGKAISSAGQKAKWPAVAGGAALAGLAGGVALGAKRKSGAKLIGKPIVNGSKAGRGLAEAGKGLGAFSENLGLLAGELRQTREALDDKGRSPVEVVLRALTARR